MCSISKHLQYQSEKTSILVYMFLNVDIEESSILTHPDIEVETSISKFLQYRDASISKYKTSISTNLQYRGTSISMYTNNNIDTLSFDIEVAYRTRYRRHKSKRRYRRFMMQISAYTNIEVMARFQMFYYPTTSPVQGGWGLLGHVIAQLLQLKQDQLVALVLGSYLAAGLHLEGFVQP